MPTSSRIVVRIMIPDAKNLAQCTVSTQTIPMGVIESREITIGSIKQTHTSCAKYDGI